MSVPGATPLPVDREFVMSTLRDMVRIDSINPSLVPLAAGEREIAAYIGRVMETLGSKVEYCRPSPGRCSVLATMAGKGGGRSLMLNGHIDTVGVEGMGEPFAAEERNGRFYGRGAYDMKSGVVACMAAMKTVRDAGIPLAGDVVLAAVADEEHASIGTFDIVTRCKTDGAIVAEPTEMAICLAHKGFVWYEIEIEGRAAHGSRFDLGIDANIRMGRVLARLETLFDGLIKREPHPLLGPPSAHAATLAGGAGLSTYASSCRLGVERRTLPGEREEAVLAEAAAILDELRADDPTLNVELTPLLCRDPFEVDSTAAVVTCVQASAERVLGHRPRLEGQPAWMDAAILAGAGIETVVMGAKGTGAHAAEEWVDVESVLQLSSVFAETIVSYCS